MSAEEEAAALSAADERLRASSECFPRAKAGARADESRTADSRESRSMVAVPMAIGFLDREKRSRVDAHITAGGEAEGCAVSVMTNFRTDVITTPSF